MEIIYKGTFIYPPYGGSYGFYSIDNYTDERGVVYTTETKFAVDENYLLANGAYIDDKLFSIAAVEKIAKHRQPTNCIDKGELIGLLVN